MSSIVEKFGAGLVRVLKKVKRKGSDGSTKTVNQAFHVRKASPGDQYAAAKTKGNTAPKTADAAPQPSSPAAQASQVDIDPAAAVPQPIPVRVTVRCHDIPWARDAVAGQPVDPVSAMLRKRFQKGSQTIATTAPDVAGLSLITVAPTDSVIWGAGEPELLNSLRSGTIKKMRLVGGGNGLMVTKIESIGGGSFYAYMWIESLRTPLLRQLWGDIIDFSVDDGPLSRRAACAYEISKACGLDDLVPPTVYRIDSDGDVISMLPDSLIENSLKKEWVARAAKKDPEEIRSQMSKYSSVQLIRGDLSPIESEEWFKGLFGNEDIDAMNNIWKVMPPDRRSSIIRSAVFDFVIGNLDRSFGDIAFSGDLRHPVMLFGSELCMPCPRIIGRAYSSGGYGSYTDAVTSPGALPLFWSELSTMVAIRGGDEEINDFELTGISISSRMREDRPMELARALLEHRATPLQMAGVLSRIWMLETYSKDIAKDPYFAAKYYSSVVSGSPDPGMDGIMDFVNNSLRRVLARDFDFYKEMKSKDDDEDTH